MSIKESLLPVSIALVGALVGFFLATSRALPESRALGVGPALTPGLVESDVQLLIQELRALGDRISALHSRAHVVADPPNSDERKPVPQTGDDAPSESTADVVQLLGRCADLVERLERRVSASSPQSLSSAPPGATRKGLEQFDGSPGHQETEMSKAHLMWSYQQVLDRYGIPDNVWVAENSTISWYYVLQTIGKEREYIFRFVDGLVYSCNF